ncbi:armadillo-type protein [Mycena crocata]|nr:armadillo-type protein [Mycena crocata]
MLSTLAAHDSTVGLVLGSQPCERLVTLLRDNDTAVRGGAIQALSQIARNTNGSKAVVNVSTLDFVQELLESGSNEVRSWTCLMLGELVRHEVAADVLPSEICVQLVTLLRDDDINVVANAICALSHIAVYEDGARAVMDASAPKFARELLESVNSEVRSRTSLMLGNLAGYESFMADTVLAPELSVQLVALLSDGDIDVVENSMYTLSQITSQPNGANAAMDATVLKCTPELLQSVNSEVRRWTCYMLGNLAGDENFTVAVLASVQCPQLVVLLRDTNVVESAIYALSHIASTPNGANAVMNAGALQFAEGLLDSEDSEVRRWTSLMLGNLAGHEGFSAAALTSELEIVWEMGTKAIGKRRLVRNMDTTPQQPHINEARRFRFND